MFVPFLVLILLTVEAFTFEDYPNYYDNENSEDDPIFPENILGDLEEGIIDSRGGDLDTCADLRRYYKGYFFEVKVQTLENFHGGYEVTTTGRDVYEHFQLTTGDKWVKPGGRIWAAVTNVVYFEERCYLKTLWFFPVRDREDWDSAQKYRCNLALQDGTLHMTEQFSVDEGFCIKSTEMDPLIRTRDKPYEFNDCQECNRESFTLYMTIRENQKWFQNFEAEVVSRSNEPLENVLLREKSSDGVIYLVNIPAAAMLVDTRHKRRSIHGDDFEFGWHSTYG